MTVLCFFHIVINYVLQLCSTWIICSTAKLVHLSSVWVFNYNQTADVQANMLQVAAVSLTSFPDTFHLSHPHRHKEHLAVFVPISFITLPSLATH